MALSDHDSGSDSARASVRENDGALEASNQNQEASLPRIDIPPTPTIPPPPDIQYTRPSLGKATPSTDSTRQAPGMGQPGIRSGDERRSAGNTANAVSVGAGLGAATTFVGTIVVSIFIGQWLDHKFGFDKGGVPWATIVLFFLGLAAGFINLFRLLSISERHNGKK